MLTSNSAARPISLGRSCQPRLSPFFLLLGLCLALQTTPAYAEHAEVQLANARFVSPEETLLISALHHWEIGNPSLAETALDSLLELAPKFEVAQSLNKAIRSQPLLGEHDVYQALLAHPLSDAAKTEFTQRWEYFLQPAPFNHIPDNLIRLSETQQYATVVDLSRNRAYLFENKENQAHLVADMYAGIGSEGFGKTRRGDKKTPIGVYFVTQQLADNELDELYGIGAFPLNYPNALDRDRERTGDGIWIHGVPRKTWTRAPRSSRGCVTVANRDFQRLTGRIAAGNTPVVLTESINWVAPKQTNSDRDAVLAAIADWADDWQKLNTKAYLGHYSSEFKGQKMDLAQWAAHKYRVNENKQWIKLELDDISLFKDPREDIIVATFLQDYRSNNFSSKDSKRMFWQRQDDGSWKILYENGV